MSTESVSGIKIASESFDQSKMDEPKKYRTEKYLSTYVNNSGVISSPFECRLFFSEVTQGVDGKLEVEEKASIVMSLQHAKAFLQLFMQNIARHEERFGEIGFMPLGRGDQAEVEESAQLSPPE